MRTRFGVEYTLLGLDLLLHQLGRNVSVPDQADTERDEERLTAWQETWPAAEGRRRTWPGWSSKTSPARG